MGWDDDSRGPRRNPRMGAPGGSSRRNPVPPAGLNPYAPYQPQGSVRMPILDASGHWAAPDQTGWTSTQMAAVGQHHHFSLFHDGNAGHLWRGEVASLLGDAVFTVGTLMWLVSLMGSPFAVALALALLGIPWLLAGPLAAPLTRVNEPGRGLAWIGRLRFLLALGFIPMHFRTIYPVIFALIFGIALCGRLREALRVAAFRTCLAPGEMERVSSDLYVGGAIVAVVGPLVATLAFTLLGERVLLVGVIAAVCYLLASNSDGFLDALEEPKRAFLHVQPDEDDMATLMERGDEDDDWLADPRMRRELALPEWYQVAPSTVGQAVSELRAGMALAGGVVVSQTALVALGLFGLVGGGLAALEIFFVQDRLGLPGFYLGPLLAAEAGGLALGTLLGDSLGQRGRGRPALIIGALGTGIALAAMALAPMLPATLGCALLLGLFNALAVSGARTGLFAGFLGFERRAIAAAETWLVALCGVIGALVFVVFYAGLPSRLPSALARLPFPGLPVGMIFLGTGGGMAIAAIIFALLLARRQRAASTTSATAAGAQGDYDDDYDGYGANPDGESAYMPAADGWDDDEQGGWGEGDYDDAASAYGPAQSGRYGAPGRSRSRAPNRRGGLLGGQYGGDDDGYDDEDDGGPPQRRGGAPGRSSPGGSRYRR